MIKTRNLKFVAAVVFCFMMPASASGFNFGNVLKGLQEKVPQEKGGQSSGFPGGLFGQQPDGNQAPGKTGSNETAGGDGKPDPSTGKFIKFVCSKYDAVKLKKVFDIDEETLEEYVGSVVKDFKAKTKEDVQAVMQRNYSSKNGPVWAYSPDFFSKAFNGEQVRLIFKQFLEKDTKRIETAAIIKWAATSGTLEEEKEILDATFAYSLILAKYEKFLNGRGKSAWKRLLKRAAYPGEVDDLDIDVPVQGAAYARIKMLYLGDGVSSNIGTAAGEMMQLLEYNEENQDGDDKKIPDDIWWDEIEKLQLLIVLHPDYPHPDMARSLMAAAEKYKADLQKQHKSNSGSALRRKVDRLAAIRTNSLGMLREALNIAATMSETDEEFLALVEKTKKANQTIPKKVIMDLALQEWLAKKLENTQTTLDPAGVKMLKEARNNNRYIIAQGNTIMFETAFAMVGAMSQGGMMGGALSDAIAITNELEPSEKAACRLDKAVLEYAAKKQLSFGKDDKKIRPIKGTGKKPWSRRKS